MDSSQQKRKKKRKRRWEEDLGPASNPPLPLWIVEREKHQFSGMDGGLGISRRFATLHATGEEGGTAKDILGIYNATDSNSHGRLTADATETRSRINLRNRGRIGTWNLQTLYQTGRLASVIQEMNRCGISTLAIAETHWIGKKHRYRKWRVGHILWKPGS